VPEILAAIADAHLAVVGNKLVEITSEAVADFYKEHVNKPFFADLERFMTSGPAVALVLEGSFAVKAWRQLMGPTNSHVARTKAPASLRARFGTDNTMNACHGLVFSPSVKQPSNQSARAYSHCFQSNVL
jgi:nucleoside-diphosphate kinase